MIEIGGSPTPSAQASLRTAVRTNYEQSSVVARNLTNIKVPAYVKEEIDITERNYNGIRAGVKTSDARQVVDENLVAEIRSQQSIVSELQELDSLNRDLENLWGQKDTQATFAHSASNMADALQAFAKAPTNTGSQINAAASLENHAQGIRTLADKIQELRAKVDIKLSETKDKANQLIAQIAEQNALISKFQIQGNKLSDAHPYMNSQRQALNDLADIVGIKILPYKDGQVAVYTESYQLLIQGDEYAQFSHTATPVVNANGSLSALEVTGFGATTDLTTILQQSDKSGRFKALLTMRDSTLPGFQAQLDEYTKNLRDSLNEIHNYGTSTNPPQTLKGTIGAPGIVGPLTNATVISGSGTVRIAVVNHLTKEVIGTPVDFALTDNLAIGDNTTAGSLIFSLNNDINNVGFFTASLTADGEFQLQATNTSYGVAITSIGGTPAKLSAGATYTSTNSYGFSHYFGLNNIFQTSIVLPGQPITGIANLLSVQDSIINTKGATLATTQLSSDTPPPTNAFPAGDISTLNSLAGKMSTKDVTFASAGSSAGMTNSLLFYSASIIETNKSYIANNSQTLKTAQYTFNALTEQAHRFSKPDERELLQRGMEISTSQAIASQALKYANEMDRELLKI